MIIPTQGTSGTRILQAPSLHVKARARHTHGQPNTPAPRQSASRGTRSCPDHRLSRPTSARNPPFVADLAIDLNLGRQEQASITKGKQLSKSNQGCRAIDCTHSDLCVSSSPQLHPMPPMLMLATRAAGGAAHASMSILPSPTLTRKTMPQKLHPADRSAPWLVAQVMYDASAAHAAHADATHMRRWCKCACACPHCHRRRCHECPCHCNCKPPPRLCRPCRHR